MLAVRPTLPLNMSPDSLYVVWGLLSNFFMAKIPSLPHFWFLKTNDPSLYTCAKHCAPQSEEARTLESRNLGTVAPHHLELFCEKWRTIS